MKKKHKSIFRLFALALGEKSGKTDNESDIIAWIRIFMFLSIFVTNCFIVANAIRHWEDNKQNSPIECIIVNN